MNKQYVVMSDCRSCYRNTRHECLFEVEEETTESWINEKETWRIVRCLGCHTYSFQFRRDDYDDLEEDPEGNVNHSVQITVFPSIIRNHRGLGATYFLPPLISKIYQQTLKSLSQQANVLASIGLRACIEAVCNHLEISGTNLQKRIDSLFKAGHVSNGDKKRLHAIRFLGNDAAHEIKEPNPSEIRIALEIVEHLLNTVYILERRAANLETVAENYEEFIELLKSCVLKYESGNAINLLGLLGRQRRLIASSIDPFESQLRLDIASGHIDFLSVGPSQEVDGKEIQLYEVHANRLADDDIPF